MFQAQSLIFPASPAKDIPIVDSILLPFNICSKYVYLLFYFVILVILFVYLNFIILLSSYFYIIYFTLFNSTINSNYH